eukprot:CFRG0057T1
MNANKDTNELMEPKTTGSYCSVYQQSVVYADSNILHPSIDSSTQLKWDDHLERITRLESTFGQSAICAVLPEANFCDHSGLYLLMSRQASHASSSFVVPDNAVAITVILDLVKGYLKSAQTMIDDKLTRITQLYKR